MPKPGVFRGLAESSILQIPLTQSPTTAHVDIDHFGLQISCTGNVDPAYVSSRFV